MRNYRGGRTHVFMVNCFFCEAGEGNHLLAVDSVKCIGRSLILQNSLNITQLNAIAGYLQYFPKTIWHGNHT
jgi:hypothetical protein